jgi:hypothetical protein
MNASCLPPNLWNAKPAKKVAYLTKLIAWYGTAPEHAVRQAKAEAELAALVAPARGSDGGLSRADADRARDALGVAERDDLTPDLVAAAIDGGVFEDDYEVGAG